MVYVFDIAIPEKSPNKTPNTYATIMKFHKVFDQNPPYQHICNVYPLKASFTAFYLMNIPWEIS